MLATIQSYESQPHQQPCTTDEIKISQTCPQACGHGAVGIKEVTSKFDAPALRAEDDLRESLQTLLAAFPNPVHVDVQGCDGTRNIIPLLKESGGPLEGCACSWFKELRVDCLCAEDQACRPSDFGPAAFAVFSDSIERMLERRKASGSPLERLTVGVASELDTHLDDGNLWNPSTASDCLRSSLGYLLQDVDVVANNPRPHDVHAVAA